MPAYNTGKIGEEISCKFLVKQGFKILDRNYSKKFGEIDIIAFKNKETYFVEVKTKLADLNSDKISVSQETQKTMGPEERVDRWKLRRISKAVQIYLSEKNLTDSDWRFLVISVLFDPRNKTAKVKIIEDVIPE